jgi:hypothetical protein
MLSFCQQLLSLIDDAKVRTFSQPAKHFGLLFAYTAPFLDQGQKLARGTVLNTITPKKQVYGDYQSHYVLDLKY